MATPHHWRECRPTMLASPDVAPEEHERREAAAQRAFHDLTDAERKRFHEFTCLNQTGPLQSAVMEKLRRAVAG